MTSASDFGLLLATLRFLDSGVGYPSKEKCKVGTDHCLACALDRGGSIPPYKVMIIQIIFYNHIVIV